MHLGHISQRTGLIDQKTTRFERLETALGRTGLGFRVSQNPMQGSVRKDLVEAPGCGVGLLIQQLAIDNPRLDVWVGLFEVLDYVG